MRTYLRAIQPVDNMLDIVAQANAVLRTTMRSLGVTFGRISLLEPPPDGVATDSVALEELTEVPEIREKIQAELNLDRKGFVIDVASFPFKSSFTNNRGSVVIVAPGQWRAGRSVKR